MVAGQGWLSDILTVHQPAELVHMAMLFKLRHYLWRNTLLARACAEQPAQVRSHAEPHRTRTHQGAAGAHVAAATGCCSDSRRPSKQGGLIILRGGTPRQTQMGAGDFMYSNCIRNLINSRAALTAALLAE
jgi:hypothetical protein